jgi:putative transposase
MPWELTGNAGTDPAVDFLGTVDQQFQQTEGAKFWLHVLSDLKTRGVADILFVCFDGLTGFPEAIEATFPHATVQTCLVHQVRSSMRFVSYKDRKPLAGDLRKIYSAVDAEHAADELIGSCS